MKRIAAVLGLGLVLFCTAVQADTIDFAGTNGGIVSYAGGATPIVGTNLPINSVFGIPPGSGSTVPVVGGLLNFSTGNFSGAALNLPGDPFISLFLGGGSFSITGGVPAAGIADNSLLLQGFFGPDPVFSYSGSGLASLSGTLFLTSIDPSLIAYFGLPSSLLSGVLAQADFSIAFDGLPAPGVGFTGSQASVNVAVELPEPGSMVLLGTGLIGLMGFTSRRKRGARESLVCCSQ